MLVRRAPTLLSPPTRAGFPSVPPASQASLARLSPRGSWSSTRLGQEGRGHQRLTQNFMRKRALEGPRSKSSLRPPFFSGELVVDLVDVRGFEVGGSLLGWGLDWPMCTNRCLLYCGHRRAGHKGAAGGRTSPGARGPARAQSRDATAGPGSPPGDTEQEEGLGAQQSKQASRTWSSRPPQRRLVRWSLFALF